jgi:alkanesulfonate monooxygenase SsuD/methylene tetrahydromethanopterin reductase-like flavin-dependent oxidoreductase (luciferase family)
MRLTMDQLSERARAAEAAGFAGVAGMDHLAPPGAESQPMFEPMVANTWVAARTTRLRVGSLVLCDSFRHPAILAKEAVTLDHASGGRFELGIGWGSVPEELDRFGVGTAGAGARIGRLKESLEIMTALWRGEVVDYEGKHFSLHGAQQLPAPLEGIPITIGGAGARTMELVAAYADWWNIHISILERFDEMLPRAGRAKPSMQVQVAFVGPDDARDEVEQTAQRRFGWGRFVLGDAAELTERFSELRQRGVERLYVWFTDFAPPETLAAFGETVIAGLGAGSGSAGSGGGVSPPA